MELEELKKTWRNWRNCRLNYPGWVIAPEASRESLWDRTQYWIEPAFHHAPELNPIEALAMIYELNWRLETTLMPLWINHAEVIATLLNKIPIESPNRRALLKSAALPDDIGWTDIEEAWMQLAFAVMREAREDLDEERFSNWVAQTQQLTARNAAWRSRWFYEQCLFNVFTFNQRKLRGILNEWKPIQDLPFWEAKRASIFAELGELKDAERIAREALDVIRSRLQPFFINHTLLSQEGWVMTLLNIIQSNRNFAREDGDNYRARWNQLEAQACNPWIERRVLELAVSAPPPSRVVKKENQEFDPGRITVTISSGPAATSYRPGFALLRMYEEGGLPMRCGNVNVSGKAIANATVWIEQFAPLWALVSNIRAGNKEALKKNFDRVRVATLTEKEITNLYKLLSHAAADGIQEITVNPTSVSSLGGRGLPLACELLSRLSFRLPPTELERLFDFATRLYSMTSHAWHIQDCLTPLFERVLDAASFDQVTAWLPRIFSLPILSEGGFVVPEHVKWPEPSLFVEWHGHKFQADSRDPKLASTVSLLIRLSKEGHPEARQRSLLRLAKLLEANLLTKRENSAFIEAIWARTDPVTGLPNETRFYNFAFLEWPRPHEKSAKERLKQLLLSSEIPKIVQVEQLPDGKKQKSMNFGLTKSSFFPDLFGATKSFWKKEKQDRKIDWNAEEADALLRKGANWWDDQKQFINDFEELRESLRPLVDLLSNIVLPRLNPINDDSLALAKRMLSEMEALKIPIVEALPILAAFDSSSSIAGEKIHQNLMSNEKEEVTSAISAIFLWAVYSKKRGPKVPQKLISALAMRILAMRQPGLEMSLAYMSRLIRETPNLITESDFDLLGTALQNLLVETELPSSRLLSRAEFEPNTLPLLKRPSYRQYSARLAFALFEFAKKQNVAIPKSIEAWRFVCQSDPLPEVRREWKVG